MRSMRPNSTFLMARTESPTGYAVIQLRFGLSVSFLTVTVSGSSSSFNNGGYQVTIMTIQHCDSST